MKKVLYFIDSFGTGGIQRLVEKWAFELRKNGIEVEFLVLDYGYVSSIEKNMIKNNFVVHKIYSINFNMPFFTMKYGKKLDSFFKKHNDYIAVHLHTSSKNYQVLKYAKKYGIKVRIIHSHSSNFKTNSLCKKIVGNLFKYPMEKYATHFFACSDSAGEWLFSNKIINSGKYYIIKNSIDYKKFVFNGDIRNKIRKEINVDEDVIVIGQIGRLSEVKNHIFSINMYEKYYRQNKKSILLIFGDGELRYQLENKVKQRKLEKQIIFMGDRDNINEYLQGIDLVILPSIYEGLPMILVEAQASGTKCIASTNVSKLSNITGDVIFLPIDNYDCWIETIQKMNFDKKDNSNKIIKSGFSINDTISELINIYKGD